MRKRLGQILIDAGIISEEQLRAALVEAASAGLRVGELLIRGGACSEYDIVKALATQLGVPLAPLETVVMIPDKVLEMVPPRIAIERRVLPLFLDSKTGLLDVAISDPTDYELLDELRFLTGHSVRPMVARPAELEVAIRNFYGVDETEVAGPRPWPQPRSAGGSGDGTFVSAPELVELNELMKELVSKIDLAAPRVELEVLQGKLVEFFQAARHAAAGQQTLVEMLADQSLLDRGEFARRVRARVEELDSH